MSSSEQHAEDDLAFLRRLVEGDRGAQFRKRFGIVYSVWGVAWGLYALLQWQPLARALQGGPVQDIALVVTVLASLGATSWSVWTGRRSAERTLPTRAMRAVFAGIGMSYLSVLAVLIWLSERQHDPTFVMVYAVVVYAGQGAGWYVAWALQRRAWLVCVASSWYVAALVLGFSIPNHAQFVLTTAVSLLLLMGIPGLTMASAKTP